MESMTIDELMELHAQHERELAALVPQGYRAAGDVMVEDPYWMEPTRPSALMAELARRKAGEYYDSPYMPDGWRAVGREVNEYDPSWSQLRPSMDTPNLSGEPVVTDMYNPAQDFDFMSKPPTRRRT